MISVFKILKEQFDNFHLIRRLSMFEITSKNRNNFLGSTWEILNLVIQVAIYWFVFSNVMKRSDVVLSDGTTIPYFYWLLTGFILWIFIYKSIINGSSSIYSRIKLLSKMNFPKSIVPSFVIFSQLYVHFGMLALTVIILNVTGFIASVHYLEIIYVLAATYFLVLGISLITSTLSTIVRDVHMLISATLKMFIYLSPVLWQIGNINGVLGDIVKLNPFYYLIEAYRAALFGNEWYFIAHWEYTIYFWVVSLIIFYIGTKLHNRFKRHLVDYY